VSFLSPWFLLGMLAVAVPIVLHLLARERTIDVRLPTWRFLDRAPVEQTRRRRVTDLLLLALRVAALALLAILFARPFLPSFEADRLLVVAVDTSGSMSAPATWASAREVAARHLDGHAGKGRVALVAYDHAIRTIVEPTRDAGAADRALGGLAPRGGRGHLGALVNFVSGAWPGDAISLVVVSDLQHDEGAQEVVRPALVDVAFAPVPPARQNLSVDDVLRSADGADLVVRNHGPTGARADVALAIDDRTVAEAAADIGAGETRRIPVRVAWPEAGLATGRVRDDSGMTADNAWALVLDRAPPLRAILVVERLDAPMARYLGDAVASTPFDFRIGLETVQSGDRAAVRRALGSTRAGDVAIVASTRGLDRALAVDVRDATARGAGVLGVAGPSVDVPILLEALSVGDHVRFVGLGDAPSPLLPDDVRHPVLAAFGPLVENVSRVDVRRWAELVAAPGTRVVARLEGGRPALVELPAAPGRMLLLATDLGRAWNDFPVEPVFVPFVIETIRYLSSRRDGPASITVADAVAGSSSITVPGAVTLGHPPRRVAVNPDLRESVLRFDSAEAVARLLIAADAAAVQQTKAATTERGQGLWRAVLLLMALVLAAESWVAGRTRRAPQPAGGTP
jgi:hypothetical protein